MGLCQLVNTQSVQITIPISTSSGQPVFSLLMSYSALYVCSIGAGGVSENTPGSGGTSLHAVGLQGAALADRHTELMA